MSDHVCIAVCANIFGLGMFWDIQDIHMWLLVIGILRPSIPEVLKGSCADSEMHIWQLDDPTVERVPGNEPKWMNLPKLLQDFTARTFAKYQLDLHIASKKMEAGSLTEDKFREIERKFAKPFVMMQPMGQPATPKYVKERVYTNSSGSLELKARMVQRWFCYALLFLFPSLTNSIK